MCGEPLVLIFTLHLDNSESAEQGRLPFCSEVKNGGTRSAVTPFRGARPRLYLCDGKMSNTSRSHPIKQPTQDEAQPRTERVVAARTSVTAFPYRYRVIVAKCGDDATVRNGGG